jgi:hypothetical protein
MPSAVAEARRVLKDGGLLLDIHPADEPTSLEVWHAHYGALSDLEARPENLEAIHRAPVGWLDHDQATLRDFTAATDALAGALEDGFDLQHATTFDYRYFFDTLDELTDYLADDWERATLSPEVLERAVVAMRQASTPPKLVVVQRTAVTALRKC